MSEDDRERTYYKGFELVAKPGKPEAKGRAWHRIANKNFAASAPEVDDVLRMLRLQVDRDMSENMAVYQAAVTAKHRELLAKIGKPYKGCGSVSRHARASHCHHCKGPVANLFDLECVGCGWIVCNYCASCGCNYRQLSSEIEAILKPSGPKIGAKPDAPMQGCARQRAPFGLILRTANLSWSGRQMWSPSETP